MHRPGHQLLAGPRFSQDEDRGVGGGRPCSTFTRTDRIASLLPTISLEVVLALDFFPKIDVFLMQAIFQPCDFVRALFAVFSRPAWRTSISFRSTALAFASSSVRSCTRLSSSSRAFFRAFSASFLSVMLLCATHGAGQAVFQGRNDHLEPSLLRRGMAWIFHGEIGQRAAQDPFYSFGDAAGIFIDRRRAGTNRQVIGPASGAFEFFVAVVPGELLPGLVDVNDAPLGGRSTAMLAARELMDGPDESVAFAAHPPKPARVPRFFFSDSCRGFFPGFILHIVDAPCCWFRLQSIPTGIGIDRKITWNWRLCQRDRDRKGALNKTAILLLRHISVRFISFHVSECVRIPKCLHLLGKN